MAEPGHGLGLDPEPGEEVGADLAAAPDHLQGDQPLQAPLPGLVDDAHPPFTELLQQVIARDVRPPGVDIARDRANGGVKWTEMRARRAEVGGPVIVRPRVRAAGMVDGGLAVGRPEIRSIELCRTLHSIQGIGQGIRRQGEIAGKFIGQGCTVHPGFRRHLGGVAMPTRGQAARGALEGGLAALAGLHMGHDAGLLDRVELLVEEPEQFFGAGAFAHGCCPQIDDGTSLGRTEE
jgi:hypothetical protein